MSTVTIIQGEDRDISFGVKDTDEDIYIDLTGASEITMKIAATAGDSVACTMSAGEILITDAPKGKFIVSIHDAKTALAKVGLRDVEVIIDWAAPKAISAWTFSDVVITLTVLAGHGFVAADSITTAGLIASTNAPNGTYTITSVTSTTIIFSAASAPTGSPTVSSATAISGKRRIVQALKTITVVKRLF